MQADIFKRDFKLREQDMVILRLEQHRSLCDTLIFQQRRLIVDNNLSIPDDLNELFYLYSRDVNDGQLMRDLAGTRSTSNSSMATLSPKPNHNAFLTQIEEENGDQSTTPTLRFDLDNSNSSSINKTSDASTTTGLFSTSWSKRPSVNNDFESQINRVFQKSNKAPAVMPNSTINNNKANFKKSKDLNYYSMNSGNYISGNGSGGLVSTSLGPQLALNQKDKNNLSMLSSSTNDSNNMEVIFENTPTTSNKQLITTPARINGKYGVLTSNNSLTNPNIIIPPGQIISNSTGTYSLTNNKNKNQQSNQSDSNAPTNSAKRHTQVIAAIAAQRKASLHHKELMQELGHQDEKQASDALTLSRLAKHDQNYDNESNLFEKKNSVLTDGSNRAKKQVKIKDIVQFKLPDDHFQSHDDDILSTVS